MTDTAYDLCVIGAGINGAGIARDAAGRGLSVLLVEQGDPGRATSSASTKLIHGGLRYLEYYEFRLVREALKEREVLLSCAPHVIRPLEFVLPHDETLRPAWMIRAGLFLYDRLGGLKRLPSSRRVALSGHPFGDPLQDRYGAGFVYADCRVDDARLVILNVVDAALHGADIRVRTSCAGIEPDGKAWTIRLRDEETGAESLCRAGTVVNATGPWVRTFLEANGLADDGTPQVRLVKGSHIVVPALFHGTQAYILQQPDRRIVFAIPYQDRFMLIGTTEEPGGGDPACAEISKDEIDYLCAAINRSFKKQITPADVIWSYSGVRPLLDSGEANASAVTRDYVLHRTERGGLPLLSVFGGKITTYRRLAEQAVDQILAERGESRPRWSGGEPLPGGDIPGGDIEDYAGRQAARYPWIPLDLLRRYVFAYGTRMNVFLKGRQSLDDLGKHYGGHLYEAEVKYLIAQEYAVTADDILWRRTKLGLHVSADVAGELAQVLKNRDNLKKIHL